MRLRIQRLLEKISIRCLPHSPRICTRSQTLDTRSSPGSKMRKIIEPSNKNAANHIKAVEL